MSEMFTEKRIAEMLAIAYLAGFDDREALEPRRDIDEMIWKFRVVIKQELGDCYDGNKHGGR